MAAKQNKTNFFPRASVIRVLTPTVSHSQPLTSNEALQDLLVGFWTPCGHCGGSLDSDVAQFQHVVAPKVHSC